MEIGPYTLTSNNRSGLRPASLRVKRAGVVLLVLKTENISYDPVGYIQRNMQAPERQQFIDGLLAAGVSREEVEKMLVPVPTRYFKLKKKAVVV